MTSAAQRQAGDLRGARRSGDPDAAALALAEAFGPTFPLLLLPVFPLPFLDVDHLALEPLPEPVARVVVEVRVVDQGLDRPLHVVVVVVVADRIPVVLAGTALMQFQAAHELVVGLAGLALLGGGGGPVGLLLALMLLAALHDQLVGVVLSLAELVGTLGEAQGGVAMLRLVGEGGVAKHPSGLQQSVRAVEPPLPVALAMLQPHAQALGGFLEAIVGRPERGRALR